MYSHDEFVSVNNELKEYDDMKKEILITSKFHKFIRMFNILINNVILLPEV